MKWQRKLLPFTTRFLVVMAIGFFALSIFDVYHVEQFLRNDVAVNIRDKVEARLEMQRNAQPANASADVVQQSLLLMEADAIDKRYRHASALLMSRIWTRQLAFITGMVLAFIGAVFILSKLSEGRSDVSVGVQDWKSGISSTSPGLVLAFFGTVLVVVSLVVQPKIEVKDSPLYFMAIGLMKNPDAQSAQQSSEKPPPIDLFEDMPEKEK